MAIPKFLQPYVPSYNVSGLDSNDPAVADEIITQVLNLGDDKAVAWIFNNFTLNQIRSVVQRPQRGVWYKESLNYWKGILKINKVIEERKAILNIYPV